jgi:hypothetical protein
MRALLVLIVLLAGGCYTTGKIMQLEPVKERLKSEYQRGLEDGTRRGEFACWENIQGLAVAQYETIKELRRVEGELQACTVQLELDQK